MIKYEPVTGLTIEEAFIRACDMAKTQKDLIHAIINDLDFFLTPKSNPFAYITLYKKRLEQKYKIQHKVR